MAKKKQKNKRGLIARFAGGGRNARGRSRGSNRPRGEGRGFIDSLRALFGRGG